MIEALAVAVEPLSLRVVTLDGGRTDASVFLHTASGRHLGPETLGERIADRDSLFLPCEVAGGLDLVNLDHVAYFECAADLPELEDFDQLASFRAAAVLELASGERLAGELRYRLPPFSCRISDLLNGADRFLLLTTGTRCLYVNRRAVVRVRMEARSCQ